MVLLHRVVAVFQAAVLCREFYVLLQEPLVLLDQLLVLGLKVFDFVKLQRNLKISVD